METKVRAGISAVPSLGDTDVQHFYITLGTIILYPIVLHDHESSDGFICNTAVRSGRLAIDRVV